jgi:periplasmic protein TonB
MAKPPPSFRLQQRVATFAMIAPLLILLQAASPSAEQAPTPEDVARPAAPRFRQAPNVYEASLAFPQQAADTGVSGDAVLRCRANAVGRLADCTVKEETPAGYGFGKAAMSLRSKFRLEAPAKGADPWVEVRIGFDATRSLVIW